MVFEYPRIGGGLAASKLVFGRNPVDLSGRDARGGDLLFPRDASLSGEFARQWKLRTMAEEAALRVAASSKLRRILAYIKSFNCADVKIGGSVPFFRRPTTVARLVGAARRNFWMLMKRE